MDDICGGRTFAVNKNKENDDNATNVTLRTCPFIKYDDGYEYPNLYRETDDMLQACILVYPMAELRRLVRNGTLQDDTVLKLPLTAKQVLQVVETHKHVLVNTAAFGQDFHLDILKAIADRQILLRAVDEKEETTLVAFDDEFEREELVYAIAVNHSYKRITVIFRGTMTRTDWATNIETFMKEIPNPMQWHALQQPTVHVHNGFHDYMFSPTERGATGPNGEPLSEYQEILQEHVLPVVKQYPGYKVSSGLWLLLVRMHRLISF